MLDSQNNFDDQEQYQDSVLLSAQTDNVYPHDDLYNIENLINETDFKPQANKMEETKPNDSTILSHFDKIANLQVEVKQTQDLIKEIVKKDMVKKSDQTQLRHNS